MGLIELFREIKVDGKETDELLDYLWISATELDTVIMNITDLSGIITK